MANAAGGLIHASAEWDGSLQLLVFFHAFWMEQK
jgi:hypothetical protein